MNNNDKWVEKYGESFMNFPLKGLKFRKSTWTQTNNHTHCLFCGKEITGEIYNYPTEKEGYVSTMGNWWSCAECFETFTKKYKLPLVKNTVLSIENALTKNLTVIISMKNRQYILKSENGKIVAIHNGDVKSYDDIITMEREQMFYGKPIREIIEDVYIGFRSE